MMMNRAHTASRHGAAGLLLTALLSAGGCADGVQAGVDPHSFSVDTVGGIVRMHTSGSAPVWSAEPLVRLGSLEGGPQEFGSVRSVVADGDGNLYVADGQAREIRVFAPDGRHLRSFGREGAGPGEFRNLVSLAWAGDLLAANDPANARIQLFTGDGEVREKWSASATTGPPQVLRLRPAGVEEFYALVPVPRGERLESGFVRHTRAGAADTLLAPSPPAGVQRGMVCRHSDGWLRSFSFPSRPQLVYTFAPATRVASGWTESYAVSLLDAAGDTASVMSWARQPLPLDDAKWEEETEPYREMRERSPGATCEPSAPERPAHRSAFRELLFDDEGRLWVESSTESGFAWDVFSTAGEWIGTLHLPERDERVTPYVRNGVVYQVELGEMDVQFVAAYRILS